MLQSTLCYLERGDEYLMLHRVKKAHDANHDKWIGIGGKFERGESPEECALREAKEETGLTLTSYRYRGIVTFVSDRWEPEYMHLFTADGFAGLRVGNDHAGAVAVRGAGPSDEVPERKRLARAYENAVDLRRGQREVDGLVVLQNRIDPAERAADERIVPTDERGKRRLQAQFRKALRGKSIAQRAECTAFFDRDAVRER